MKCPREHRDPDRPHHTADGMTLCQPCADQLARNINALPNLHADLGNVLAGTWHDHNTDDTHPLTIAEMPLPIRADVAQARTRIYTTARTWAVNVAHARGDHGPSQWGPLTDTARYLERRLAWTLEGDWAHAYADDMQAVTGHARYLLDPIRRRRVPAGPCPTHVEGPGDPWPLPCPGTLIVRITGDEAADPTCDWCGHVVQLDHHAALRRGLATLVTAQDAAVRLGIPVGTIGAWASRGKVERRGKDARGRTLYDLTDLERMAAA